MASSARAGSAPPPPLAILSGCHLCVAVRGSICHALLPHAGQWHIYTKAIVCYVTDCRESVGTVLKYSPWRGGGRRRGSRRRWRPAARRAPRSTTDGDAPASSLSLLLPLLTLWWPALRASLSKRNELVCADQPLSLSLSRSLWALSTSFRSARWCNAS